ncbi:MAG: hypothetical protein AAF215_33330 [Cyanobacteria bacterium P01_A01_bin.123]
MNVSTASLSTESSFPASSSEAPESYPSVDDKICWIEVKSYPYKADHQVELLHLQAEADALLVELQAVNQRRVSDHQRISIHQSS